MFFLKVLLFALHFLAIDAFSLQRLSKRQTSAKAWVNGKEVDLSQGGTYTDKDGTFVSMNTNGNGVSMVSSSVSNGNSCVVTGNIVHECDGTTRPLTDRDRQLLSQYNQKIGNFFRDMFPPGFPFHGLNSFGSNFDRQYPTFPSICYSCSGGQTVVNTNAGPADASLS